MLPALPQYTSDSTTVNVEPALSTVATHSICVPLADRSSFSEKSDVRTICPDLTAEARQHRPYDPPP